jgi:GNAT superfamily N-acetyltransferase
MPDPLATAITNFAEHCQAIPTSLGFPGAETQALVSNQHTLDIPYPNAITIGDADQTEIQLTQIQHFVVARPANTPTFVVDSHNNLDLKPLGFDVMFSTPWFYREPAPLPPIQKFEPRVESVQTPAQLAEFDRAAAIGFGQPDAHLVYSTPLLSDHRYQFHFVQHAGEIVAGIQTFTNKISVGIYTLFTHSSHQRKGIATALVRKALSTSPNLPAITNPSDQSDHLFQTAGFTQIGSRTIWIHRPN